MPAVKYRLYSVLTAALFFVIFAWFYRTEIQPLFEYAFFSYQIEVEDYYYFPTLLAFVGAVALLPQKELPSNMFIITIFVFVYNSILQVSVHFISDEIRFYSISYIVAAALVLSLFSRARFDIKISGSILFEKIVWLLFLCLFVSIVASAQSKGLRFVGFWDIADLRAELSVPPISRYALTIYTFSVGPVFMAMMLFRRKYILSLVALIPYILGYLFTFQKFTLLCPIWIFGIWFCSKYRIMRLPAGQLMLFSAPFIVSTIWFSLDLTGRDAVIGLISTRLYAVPGQIFGHYVDFFSTHPNTWFSHINGINWFVAYPYDQPIPLVIKDSYPGGNQNANFWSSDAIAGAGSLAIVPVTVVFAIIMAMVNTVCRGLDPRFGLTACAVIAQNFSNGALATGLLSGGLALTMILLALAPRSRYGPKASRMQHPSLSKGIESARSKGLSVVSGSP